MTAEWYQKVKSVYQRIEPLPVGDREAALASLCDGDAQLARQVRALLEQQESDELVESFTRNVEQIIAPAAATVPEATSLVGSMVGPYEILNVLGQGGMGVIYRARDTRLGRLAALKAVLPERMHNDISRERLRREARVLASLSHPNVATLFGIEEAGGMLFLAMEFVEGKTLSQRLGRSGISILDALQVCEQVAAGLEAAHEAGVVHRDLKPGNIMFAADGTVKVLDFGLARATRSGMTDAPVGKPPTLSLTRSGSPFGTPAYMSPEQARGEPLDQRSDVFSFGCVLYRCLSGKPAFGGESDAELLDAIVNREPDWSLLPDRLPASVHQLLRRCLAKSPADRYRHIGDVRLDLREAIARREWDQRPSRTHRWKTILPYAAALVMLIAGAAAGIYWPARTTTSSAHAQRFDLTLPDDAVQGDLERIQVTISPDGKRIIVACSTPKTGRALWIRNHTDGRWRMIPRTEDAHRPVISPDGEWIVFHRNSNVFKRRLGEGGDPIRVGTSTNWYGASLDDAGSLVSSPAWNAPIYYTPAAGAPAVPITDFETTGGVSHISPVAVPGTDWTLFAVWEGGDECHVHAVNTQTKASHRVVANAGSPCVVRTPRGPYLLFERGSSIFAQAIDLETMQTRGTSTVIADGVMTDATRFAAYFSAADDGTLVYFPGRLFEEESRLAYVNEDGTTTPLNDDRLSFCEPLFAADGSKLTVAIKGKVYRPLVYDLRNGTKEFLQAGGDVTSSIPTPDGKGIIMSVNRDGGYGLDLYSLETGAFVRRIVKPGADYPSDPSIAPDGSFLVFTAARDTERPRDIWYVDTAEGSVARPLVASPAADFHGHISPDQKWIAFCSEMSGRREVHVAGLPGGNPVRQISFTGGENPFWSPDGKHIYYISPAGIAKVAVSEHGAPMSQPQIIYDKPFGQSDAIARNMAVSPDGRVLIVEPSERRPTVSHLHVITNWWQLLP